MPKIRVKKTRAEKIQTNKGSAPLSKYARKQREQAEAQAPLHAQQTRPATVRA